MTVSDERKEIDLTIVGVYLPPDQWRLIVDLIDRCEGFPSYNAQLSAQNAREMIEIALRRPPETAGG